MKVSDLLHFSKEKFFNGAVQTEWFYDKGRVKDVAESYVFHGPKYYGVSDTDLSQRNRPIDTATYAKILSEKLYKKSHGNNFLMTVAGYGTGKSHLAVCLGSLFSDEGRSREIITSNICNADKEIGTYIQSMNTRKNLVIVINGMNNFNLDAEFLRCARLVLEENGISDDIFKKLTKSYDIAKHFVEKTFEMLEQSFLRVANSVGIDLSGKQLKRYIINNLESDSKALSIVNKIYKDVNGDDLHWDRGISAGEILSILNKELCGNGKPFHKVLIFFDEFGRFIEYTAANPLIAGDASFQQIFEAVQNADGNIIFVGLIQKELKTYTLCIDKTSNFIRYIDRFKNSEEVYLSCNFETILANLIQRQDETAYDRIVKSAYTKYSRFHNSMYSALDRWDRNQFKKSVWSNNKLYEKTILEGCYPFHPITVWFLSNSTNMLQQRSAIAFASEMFDSIAQEEIKSAWLPYVYPIDIISSGLYYDLLSAEESGNSQSQYCMLYRDILTKYQDKLSENEQQVLKSILICNLCRFKFYDKDDAILAINYCSNLKPDDVEESLRSLEDMHGVVSFDDTHISFDLIAEANGYNEFKRVFNRYYVSTPKVTISACDEGTKKLFNIDRSVETSFAQEHHISSNEWSFNKELIDISKIDEKYIKGLIRRENSDVSGLSSRGTLIYVYASDSSQYINRIKSLFRQYELDKHPFVFLLLEDSTEEIIKALRMKAAINRFSTSDFQRFERFVNMLVKEKNKKLTSTFTKLVSNRQLLTSQGIANYQTRINILCTDKFNQLFSLAPPFAFDGFENKTITSAKKALANICIKLFDRSLMNIQSYQALTQAEINRIKSCISVGPKTSWELFDNTCSLVEPKNKIVAELFSIIQAKLQIDHPVPVIETLRSFTVPPYGMNENSIILLFVCFLAYKGNELYVFFEKEKLTPAIFNKKIFKDNKLQFKELRNISIQINANADKNLVADLCQKIINNRFVENCAGLKKQLSELLQVEGSLPEDQLLIASAQSRNDDGIQLNKRIYDNLSKAKTILKDNQSKLIIHKFVKIFSYLPNTDGEIEEGLPFLFSDHFKQEVERIQKGIDKLLNSQFDLELKRLNCRIKQFSQVKTLYLNVAKILNENGYQELANKTKARIVSLENELDARQKYEASLVECKRDIALNSDVSKISYAETCYVKEKIERWVKFFDEASDLPQQDKLDILNDANLIINRCNTRLAEIDHAVKTAENAFAQISSISSANKALDLLKSVIQLELPQNISAPINLRISEIEKAVSVLDTLPQTIEDLQSFIARSNMKANTPTNNLIVNEAKILLKRLLAKQEKWINTYLIPVESSTANMTAQQCVKWLNETQTVPAYLDAACISRYHRACEKVEQTLHSCRIQGVLSMFRELTSAEQEEFIRLITK